MCDFKTNTLYNGSDCCSINRKVRNEQFKQQPTSGRQKTTTATCNMPCNTSVSTRIHVHGLNTNTSPKYTFAVVLVDTFLRT